MRAHEDLKMYTLRHFLFYMGVSAAAVIGALASLMNWSIGLIYGVGLSTGAVIVVFALREGLFGTPGHVDERRHRRHA
jgi:hypothetical protein